MSYLRYKWTFRNSGLQQFKIDIIVNADRISSLENPYGSLNGTFLGVLLYHRLEYQDSRQWYWRTLKTNGIIHLLLEFSDDRQWHVMNIVTTYSGIEVLYTFLFTPQTMVDDKFCIFQNLVLVWIFLCFYIAESLTTLTT